MPPATAGASARAHLVDLLRPVVAECGVDLEEVTVTAAGRRSVVRLSVDADGGVDLDRVAAVSRRVAQVLDDDADSELGRSFAGPYVLEVSSPGVDRPLTEVRHWRRNIGRIVSVPVGDLSLTGRLVDVTDAGVEMDVDGVRKGFAFAEVGVGRVQVEFSRPAAESVDGTADSEEA